MRVPAFIRRFVRRHTKPQDPNFALRRRRNISFLYTFLTWNVLGLVVYNFYKSRKEHPELYNPDNLSGARFEADRIKAENVTLYRISGSDVKKFDLQEEKKQFGRLLNKEEVDALNKGETTVEELLIKYKVRDEMIELEDKYIHQKNE